MKKLALVLLAFLLIPVCSGCFTKSSSSAKETKVDTALSQGGLPAAPPETGPGQPQKYFDQEVEQAQQGR